MRINQNKKKCDRNFKTGWLQDEIINAFFYQLTNRNEELLYCDLTTTLVVSEGKSFETFERSKYVEKPNDHHSMQSE